MTQYNTRLGIRDYSRKDTDEFGNTRLVKRANAKRTSLPLFLRPSRLDSVREILARMHGLPALWLGDDHEGWARTSPSRSGVGLRTGMHRHRAG